MDPDTGEIQFIWKDQNSVDLVVFNFFLESNLSFKYGK